MVRRDHKGVTGFRVQPARRLRTCAKAKKTYGGLDKESLAQSGIFLMERWFMSRKGLGRSLNSWAKG
ncbi:hypothetical protein Taro_029072 [Colocasia esculenta]|uniref:Uncharacterized protein n=1 Tax=Colocasia esculenta TaxID=4460 RepID=A0A843VZ70_COLES|nr:hypothetical protein [Colocasia esculenta]